MKKMPDSTLIQSLLNYEIKITWLKWISAILLILLAFSLLFESRVVDLIQLFLTGNLAYDLPRVISLCYILACAFIFLIIAVLLKDRNLIITLLQIVWWICLVSMVLSFYLDLTWLYQVLKQSGQSFSAQIIQYGKIKASFYTILSLPLVIIPFVRIFIIKPLSIRNSKFERTHTAVIILGLPFIFLLSIPFVNDLLFLVRGDSNFDAFSLLALFVITAIYSVLMVGTLGWIVLAKHHQILKTKVAKKLVYCLQISSGIALLLLGILEILPIYWEGNRQNLSFGQVVSDLVLTLIKHIPIFIVLLSLISLFIFCRKQLSNQVKEENVKDDTNTSGIFGTARLMTEEEIEKLGLFKPENGIPSGRTFKTRRVIFLPLRNKKTLAIQGRGKTSGSSIPALLSFSSSIFSFDTKGELALVTARHRVENFGHTVVIIDPFGVITIIYPGKNGPKYLKINNKFNPFDLIPEDEKARNRMINAFTSSLISPEGGTAVHFDENARIVIRGFIDYIMKKYPKEKRSLNLLYELMKESKEGSELILEDMISAGGRASVAAHQIFRAGPDERGSILTTSLRQLDFLSDVNIQETLAKSDFDLREFMHGKMDIFVIVPEDQINVHNRLVRMILSLLMSIIAQANPVELKANKMLFLLEELAQIGYCPDVEKAIEVLRARNVVVWTVFQTIDQIEVFGKDTLFKSAPIKQFLGGDDPKTIEWIQKLGGKRTLRTRSTSNNKGDTWQKMQAFGGSSSTGEGESYQEVAADLFHANELREMPKGTQLLFLEGHKPIYCEILPYFEYPEFEGLYDPNPLES